MSSYVDLHLHTNCSDGSDSPERVVERAAEARLAAMAIVDHDTFAGVDAAERAAHYHGIEFLRGTEISACYGRVEVHIVGLGIDTRNGDLLAALQKLRAARSERVDAMLTRLNKIGIPLGRSEVEAQAGGVAALGRVHVARALRAKGVTRTVQEGFDRFIRGGRKAYVPKTLLPCREAIELIHQAGGVAILGHPGISDGVMKILPRLLAMDFDGIEVYHMRHTPGQTTQFIQIALERDLLISGGSDCHGTAVKDQPDLGKVLVPYSHFERIQRALRRR